VNHLILSLPLQSLVFAIIVAIVVAYSLVEKSATKFCLKTVKLESSIIDSYVIDANSGCSKIMLLFLVFLKCYC
jgi:hypothetical protein